MTDVHNQTEGKTEAMEELLDHGADIECLDYQDATPLLIACLGNHRRAAKILLERGANPDHAAAKSDKYRALHLAARLGNPAIAQLLLECGASENARLGKPGQEAPLHLAVSNFQESTQNEAVARTLLELGADVDVADGSGKRPMHLAIELGEHGKKMVDLLLRFGADVDKADNFGHSPIYYAARENSAYLASLWDPYGFRSEEGCSILFHAVANGNIPRVRQLLEIGYDKTEKDQWGRIPLDVAVDPELRDLLAISQDISTEDDAFVTQSNQSKSECPMDKKDAQTRRWYCDSCSLTMRGLFYRKQSSIPVKRSAN